MLALEVVPLPVADIEGAVQKTATHTESRSPYRFAFIAAHIEVIAGRDNFRDNRGDNTVLVNRDVVYTQHSCAVRWPRG